MICGVSKSVSIDARFFRALCSSRRHAIDAHIRYRIATDKHTSKCARVVGQLKPIGKGDSPDKTSHSRAIGLPNDMTHSIERNVISMKTVNVSVLDVQGSVLHRFIVSLYLV